MVGAGFKPAPIGSAIHRRRSIRLRGYDYAQAGFYFVTICVRDRECMFGEVVDNDVRLSKYGTLVAQAWEDLPNHYPHLELDRFVVMPNHFHGIVVLTPVGAGFKSANSDVKPALSDVRSTTRAGLKPAPTKRHGLPEIVRGFKTFSARRINEIRQTPGTSVWQRNYYEHVIRDESDYDRIAEYIANNPQRWEEDSLHPDNPGFEPAHSDPRPTVGAGLKPANSDVRPTVGAGLKPAPTNRCNDGGADE